MDIQSQLGSALFLPQSVPVRVDSLAAPLSPRANLLALVPVVDNDGVAFPDDHFCRLEFLFLALASGYTQNSKAKGNWLFAGKQFPEGTIPYTATVPIEHATWMARVIEGYIKIHFQQIAVRVEVTMIWSTDF